MKRQETEDPRKAPRYDDRTTVREARAKYFEVNGFGEGGYEDRWARVELLGVIPVVLPNTGARARALVHHDVNHVLSGYNAMGREGEIDIAGWKFGSGGCGKYAVAWYINLVFFAFGLFLRPRHLMDAFLRGRGGRNAYSIDIDDRFLDKRLDLARQELGIHECLRKLDTRGLLAFCLYSIVSILTLTLTAAIPLGLLSVAILSAILSLGPRLVSGGGCP